MVLKWVNLHQFPKFFQMVLKGVNLNQFTNFYQVVLKGVSMYCYTACCLGSDYPICVVWWCCTAVLVAFLHWLSGGLRASQATAVVFSPVDLCLLGFPLMFLKEFSPSPWSTSGSCPGLFAVSNGLERSCCLCLGSLLFCTPWGSLLCLWESPLAAGDHQGCLSTGCLALCC